jgi:SAM-dependent methyltransferase
VSLESEDLPARDYNKYDLEFDALPFERILEKYRLRKLIEIIDKHVSKNLNNVLEIGPGYNSILGALPVSGERVIIEPSSQLFAYNKARYFSEKYVTILNEEIKEFTSREPLPEFDLIVLSSVLHEFNNPQSELLSIIKLLKRSGNLIIVVPNNESVHRQFGVTLGILASTSTLTDTERLMQQTKSFSIRSMESLMDAVGLAIQHVTTSFVKPHTHAQMQKWVDDGLLDREGLENLYKLSHFFHPFNSEIFLIARKP